jgi:hypoxanthine phosphoribosyltransferase
MDVDIEEVLISEEALRARTAMLAADLAADFQDKCPILVCVLQGAVMFFADLTRQMKILMQLDFVTCSSYGNALQSSGVVKIKQDLSCDITGRHVILVEDIVDSGRTFLALIQLLKERNPKSISTVTMCNKRARRVVDFQPDYVAFEIDDKFIVGAGLDYCGKYRNLPYVGVLKPRVYHCNGEPLI